MTEENFTVIIVGITEKDEYGNLWVTPKDGGDKFKVASKRAQLHPLFEQGKAVAVYWSTYMNKPYVSNAKLVSEEIEKLPPVPKGPAPYPEEWNVNAPQLTSKESAPQEIGMWWKELGEWLRMKEGEKGADPYWNQLRIAYFAQMFSVLPIKAETKKE